MDCSMPGLLVHCQLPEFTQIDIHWVGDAIQPSHPVVPFSSCLQSFPESGSFQMSQFFASGGQSIGVLAFNISPPNEYSGLISFRMDWLDLLAVQGTLKSLFQHHSSKASILWSLTLSYYFVKKYIVTVTVIIEITFGSREIYILILWHTFVLYFLIYFLYFYNFQLSNILIAFLCNSMIAPAYKTYCLCIYSSFSNHGLLLVSTAVIICSFFKIQMKYHMYM